MQFYTLEFTEKSNSEVCLTPHFHLKHSSISTLPGKHPSHAVLSANDQDLFSGCSYCSLNGKCVIHSINTQKGSSMCLLCLSLSKDWVNKTYFVCVCSCVGLYLCEVVCVYVFDNSSLFLLSGAVCVHAHNNDHICLCEFFWQLVSIFV